MATRRQLGRVGGQTMVEFALGFPVFVGLLFAAIQLGLVALWYADELRLTHESTRWLAVHADASDAAVAAQIRSLMLPTMVSGTPIAGSIESGNDVVNDDNASAVYSIGLLTARFTPCVPDTASKCQHRDRSADGGEVHVQLSYDASNIIFLPHRLDLPFLTLSMPTTLPSYREWMATE